MEKRGTSLSGCNLDHETAPPRVPSPGPIRTARALARLARAHHQLQHRPTLGQIHAMGWYDGRQPLSYLLDSEQNYVPELLFAGDERELGSHALPFRCRGERGRDMQMVVMSHGGGFDLLSWPR